jgi:heavy metal sensor kinase
MLRSLMGLMCFAVPVALLLAGVGGFFLASRALRPVDRITQTAQSISARDLNERIDYQGPDDEVGRLATTFDRMLDRLQAGFEREKRFTSDAAHELRTPLTALKGRIGVTLGQGRQPTEYQDALRDMETQVDRLIRLSNDLLFIARLGHKERLEQPSDIALDDLIAALLDQVRPLAEAKTISLTGSVPPGLTIRGNMDLLIRLFLNLLDNAIKYTPAGGEVAVTAERQTERLCVHVRDSGPGIPPEQQPHLFERFYRVEKDRARPTRAGGSVQGGAGLGLAIAQEIAQAHGGRLQVRSQPGQGSTFTFCLPAPPTEEN